MIAIRLLLISLVLMVSSTGCLGLAGLGALPGATDIFADRIQEHSFQYGPGVSKEEVDKLTVSAFMLGYNGGANGSVIRQNETGAIFGDLLVNELRKKHFTPVSELEMQKYLEAHASEVAGMNEWQKVQYAAKALGAQAVVFSQLEGRGMVLGRVKLVYIRVSDGGLLGVGITTFRNPERMEDAARLMIRAFGEPKKEQSQVSKS